MNSDLAMDWASNLRWAGVTRPYSVQDVERLRGSMHIECTLARHGAERLWQLLQSESHVAALGAMTGNQAIQQVKAGLQAIYVSGWQVAADANDAGQMYPDLERIPRGCAGCDDREPGYPAGEGRAAGDLRQRLAGGGGCQRRRANVSRSRANPTWLRWVR